MHCDSLGLVSEDRGLVTKYNVSREWQYMQLFAAFVPNGETTPYMRRRTLLRLVDSYISEVNRLKLVPIYECRDLGFSRTMERSSAMLSIEGGGGLFADSEELLTVYKAGLRVMGLVWDKNELSASAWDKIDTGLTDEGFKMVERLSELGVIVDVSHMSDKAIEDTLAATSYPVIATHSNFRSVTGSPRNLPDHLAKRIAMRGGVIGLNLYPEFLSDKPTADFDDVYRHVDYALQLVGEDALALGCDIDGTDGRYPDGLGEGESIHDVLAYRLSQKYGERIAEKIVGENAFEFFKENL